MPRGSQDPYTRLGACMALAARGTSPGERAAAVEAMRRIIKALPPDQAAAVTAALQVLVPNADGTEKQFKPPRVPRRKIGTKRAEIIALLKQGYKPQRIAEMLNMKPHYVYHVKAEMKHEEQ
jgi:DNA-binding NarL/FixJ family response regulator